MAQRNSQIAIDFAILIKGMCTPDFFPNFDDVFADVNPDLPDEEWTRVYLEKVRSEQEKIIREHALGKYFLELGYSAKEIFCFVTEVTCKEFGNALKILLEEQS